MDCANVPGQTISARAQAVCSQFLQHMDEMEIVGVSLKSRLGSSDDSKQQGLKSCSRTPESVASSHLVVFPNYPA